jgi:rhodanese-related sulfurtransferase
MAENLHDRGLEVALVEKLPQVMPNSLDAEMAAYVHKTLIDHDVDLRLKDGVARFEKEDEGLAVILESGHRVSCDLAILSIGVSPDTQLGADAGLETGKTGGYVVNEHMQTNDPSIYAVGDAVETKNLVTGKPMLCALAGPANRQGRLAADHILGHDAAYRGSQATAICKVFDLTVAAAGLTTRACNAAGLANFSVHVGGASHATYYPGAGRLLIKLVFSPEEGRILGTQIVGTDGVDKRMDVLATAQRAGLTVFDLQHLELAYAPPYGSAKDPVNMVGFVASNHLDGEVPLAHWYEVLRRDPDRQAVLDCRTCEECSALPVDSALQIPLDEIHEHLEDLPKDKELLVTCATGTRSAYATRILLQNGFKARNVSGGANLYRMQKYLAEGEEFPPGQGK